MSARAVRPDQIRVIHAIKSRVRLDEGSYRAMLQEYDVPSSKYLTRADADRLIERMRDIPGASRPVERPAATAQGRYAKKLQALWIAGWNLGIVADRRDVALHAFIDRQTGLSHSRFLQDPRDASRAIEALKAWIGREAGVVWPAGRTDGAGADLLAFKRAVLHAQWSRLIATGAVPADEPLDPKFDRPAATPQELDLVSAALGAKLRKALAGRAR